MKDDRPEGRPVGEDPVITDTGGEVAALASYSLQRQSHFGLLTNTWTEISEQDECKNHLTPR